MNHMPLVSVVIPTYNRSQLILRAVRSVLEQTYTNLECIVVDDFSSDNTKEIIKSVKDERIIYLRHKDNQRASAARNTGIKCAKGDYVAFLDDDDLWLPTKLEKQMLLIQNLSEKFGMVYCWMDYFDKNGNNIKEHHPILKGNVFKHVLESQGIGGCPTLLVRKEVFESIGEFDESLPRGNDGDFIRRVCRKYMVDFIPEVLVNVYVEHGSERISDNNKQGLLNAIQGQSVKLEKFKSELKQLPIQKSNIYSTIGFHYSQLRDWPAAVRSYIKAFFVFPFSLGLYKKIYSSLLILLKR